MTEARWEWMLPGSVRVAATLASTTSLGVESVFVRGALVSQAARGAKPDGHLVKLLDDNGEDDPLEVSVTFDPRVPICILRVGGQEIAPQVWPVTERAGARPLPRRPFPSWILAVALLVVVGVAGIWAVRSRTSSGAPDREVDGVHRAENGLFIARFPKSLVARPATGLSGVVLVDEQHADAIVIVSLPSVPGDPWLFQKRAHSEALANVPRADGNYDETSRREDTCVGRPGAVVTGRVTNRRGEPARIWSCAFTRGDAGYLVMSSVREKAPPEDEKAFRRIIEATELTQLGSTPTRAP